jgi:sugar lactone lactonase YvrE
MHSLARALGVISISMMAAFSSRGELFVSSHDTSRVIRYHETTGALIDVFIENHDARLQFPHGLAFGRDGNLYVASAGNDTVVRYNGQTGQYIDNFIPAGSGGLDYPVALVFRNQYLYVSSQLNDRVLRYNAITGAYVDTFVPASTELDGPSDMTFGRDGNLYVVGRFNARVVRYNGQTGAFDRAFITSQLAQPFGLRFITGVMVPTAEAEDSLLVVSGNENTVQRFGDFTGAHKGTFASNNLNFPIGIEIGPDGNVYVASYGNDRVVRFNGVNGQYIDDFIPAGSGGPERPELHDLPPASSAHANRNQRPQLRADPMAG